MSDAVAPALAYARANRERFVGELADFVRFPSVSAQPAHAADLRRCADWLAGQMRAVGLEGVRVVPTKRHPIVCGAWRRLPEAPTVLIYGHYDVQPPDPLAEWRTPPFEPSVRGDDLFGRGASDDKGQVFAHLKAIESSLRATGALPVNVVCLVEGEEEIGSPNLDPFLRRYRSAIRAASALVSDTPMLGPDRPAITYAMRGGLAAELEVAGPARDLHSGIFGGAVHNPLQALCEVVAGLHDARGRIAVPGLYRRVRRWSEAERAYMAATGPSDAEVLRDAGARAPWGEAGYSLYERTTLRPALTVNGIVGGYQGPGGKGVIPARALAKLSFRLAPDQEPEEVERLFRAHLARTAPRTVEWRLRTHLKARPVVIDRRHPAMRAAAHAYRRAFGAAPVFVRSGGTIPVVSSFGTVLGIPTVLMGFALPDDRMHAPNEKLHLPNFAKGIAASLHYMAATAAMAVRAARPGAPPERARELVA